MISINKQLAAGKYKIRLPKNSVRTTLTSLSTPAHFLHKPIVSSHSHPLLQKEPLKLQLQREDLKMCTITCKELIKRINKADTLRTAAISLAILAVAASVFAYTACVADGCQLALCSRFVSC